MLRIVLDSNLWDRLASDEIARIRLRELIEASAVTVLVPDTLLQELARSPFGGIPNWFPVVMAPDSVFVADFSRVDFARCGGGVVFSAHRGTSNKIPDGVLADFTAIDADVLVSEDRRVRKRFTDIVGSSRAMTYNDFKASVLSLQ